MTDKQEKAVASEPVAEPGKPDPFPELAELEEQIQRRLRSNQRFLERFMDEDYDDLDDDDTDISEDDDPATLEEL